MIDDHSLLVLSRADLERMPLDWSEVFAVLRDAYAQKARGEVQNPPKPKVVPRDASFVNAMPAYLGGSDRLGIKWVSGYESNRAAGLPYIFGSLLLNDAATGRPIALLDGGWVTEIRTAGVSGVSLGLAPAHPRRLSLVGAGVQGRRHLAAALQVFPGLEEVAVHDIRPDAAHSLSELAGPRTVVAFDTPQGAVEGADVVITTVTQALDPKLDCATAAPDAVLLPVDYNDALAARAFAEAAFVAVDDRAQFESVAALGHYFREIPTPAVELGEAVVGAATVPTSGRRVFLNLGLALADVALAGHLYDRAVEGGIGTRVAFP